KCPLRRGVPRGRPARRDRVQDPGLERRPRRRLQRTQRTGRELWRAQGRVAPPGVTRSGWLIVEPGAGFSPVYSLINGARHSIDMTMYEFSDTTAEHDLAAAAKRGVRVRVILDRRARSVNSDA